MEKTVSIKLKYVQGVAVEVETLDLGAAFCAEIDKDCNRPSGCTQIAESLIVLFLGQLRQRLTLNDNIADGRFYHQIHLEEGFERLTIEERMVLQFLMKS